MNSVCDEYVWGGEKFQPVVRLKADLSPNKCVNQELQNEFTKWCTLQEWVKLRAAVMQLKEEDPAGQFQKKIRTIHFPSQQPFEILLLICPPSALARNLDTRRDLFPAAPHMSCNLTVKACAEEGMGA